MVGFQGKVTFSELRRGLFRSYSTLRHLLFIIFLALTIFSFFILLVKDALSIINGSFLLISFLVFTDSLWRPFLAAYMSLRKTSFYYFPVHGIADEEKITIENGQIKIESQWNSFTKYKLFADMVLLYKGNMLSWIFPSTLFSSQQEWLKFRGLIKNKIPITPKKIVELKKTNE
jgi:hypothetical protein